MTLRFSAGHCATGSWDSGWGWGAASQRFREREACDGGRGWIPDADALEGGGATPHPLCDGRVAVGVPEGD